MLRRLGWSLLLALSACKSSAECHADKDCGLGHVCADGRCVSPCNRDEDCDPSSACVSGRCEAVASPECDGDAACKTPGTCRVAQGATCSGGRCHYAVAAAGASCVDGDLCTNHDLCDAQGHCLGSPVLCDAPPPNECLAGDQTFRAYPSLGSCNPSDGSCSYAPQDFACPSCATSCLPLCAGLVCDQENGGCREHGVCDPTSGTATCAYQELVDGSRCDLNGTDDGYCQTGACKECLDSSHCVTPPGASVCYDATCNGGACDYALVAARVCIAQSCSGSTLTATRVCGDGTCPDAGSASCAPYTCADAASCRTSCATSADCAPGNGCRPDGHCAGLLSDGADCTGLGGGACASGHCDGTRCCASGDCCNDPSDCPPSYTQAATCNDSSGASTCQGTRRQPSCDNHVCGATAVDDDSGCAGVAHTCPGHLKPIACTSAAAQSAPACPSTCGTSADCESGYLCDASSQCILPVGVGASCGTSNDCASGNKCENGICCSSSGGTCCTSASQCGGNLACNTTSFSCETSCNNYDSSRCANPAAQYCLNGTCTATLANGGGCSDPGQCQSHACVEGVCCSSACTGTCQSCRSSETGGAEGTCANIVAGRLDVAPSVSCSGAQGCGGSSCACDGGGTCKKALGQACSPGECASGNCVDSVCCDSACNDDCKACNLSGSVGTCTNRPGGDTTECGTCQACNTAGGDCAPVTQSDGKNCVDDCSYCSAGSCQSRGAGDETECGTCQSCNAAGGDCAPETGATGHLCTSATSYCCSGTCVSAAGDYGTSCGAGDCAGSWQCNGQSATCSTNTQACAFCSSDRPYTGTCSSAGDCNATGGAECGACVLCIHGNGNATCSGAVAAGKTDTTGANQCTAPSSCNGAGSCVGATWPNGHACTSPGECQSGYCVDGYCCDTACNGFCMACSATYTGADGGVNGTCHEVLGGDPRNNCTAGCYGTCDVVPQHCVYQSTYYCPPNSGCDSCDEQSCDSCCGQFCFSG